MICLYCGGESESPVCLECYSSEMSSEMIADEEKGWEEEEDTIPDAEQTDLFEALNDEDEGIANLSQSELEDI